MTASEVPFPRANMVVPTARHQNAPGWPKILNIGVARIVTMAETKCSRNVMVIRGAYPQRSAKRLKKMMVTPNPVRPNPVMTPSSVWVKPNWVPQSLRIAADGKSDARGD